MACSRIEKTEETEETGETEERGESHTPVVVAACPNRTLAGLQLPLRVSHGIPTQHTSLGVLHERRVS